MTEIKAFVKKEKRLSVKDRWYIFVIIMLFLLLLLSSYLVYSNALYKTNIDDIGQKVLGDTVYLEIDSCGSFSQALSFYGSVLPNISIRQEGYFKVKDEQPSFVARAKLFVYNNNEDAVSVDGTLTSEWIKGDDGYYYYQYTLNENLTSKFLHAVIMPNDGIELHSSEQYDLIVSIETLPYESDFVGIWGFSFLDESISGIATYDDFKLDKI
ncbi:MAG: hypothetical protein PHH71_02460 [Clostridia bacterium]|jgi:hypothetical protein|nr:hypothetical protein [Clostridia bacterium]MDD4408657.1 hypothetical protein [Clostridia bacterium]